MRVGGSELDRENRWFVGASGRKSNPPKTSGREVSKLMSNFKVLDFHQTGLRPAEAYCFLNCRTPGSGDAR
jgi:hypothetical protein